MSIEPNRGANNDVVGILLSNPIILISLLKSILLNILKVGYHVLRVVYILTYKNEL